MVQAPEDARSKSIEQASFLNVLYSFIKSWGYAVQTGNEAMKRVLDAIEGLMYYYRIKIPKVYYDYKADRAYSYDELKKRIVDEYEEKVEKIKAKGKYEQKELDDAEYSFLKKKFNLLMLLVGRAGLMPPRDVVEEQL